MFRREKGSGFLTDALSFHQSCGLARKRNKEEKNEDSVDECKDGRKETVGGDGLAGDNVLASHEFFIFRAIKRVVLP